MLLSFLEGPAKERRRDSSSQREQAGPFESKRDTTRNINEENEAVIQRGREHRGGGQQQEHHDQSTHSVGTWSLEANQTVTK